jgi:Flp pilus assembly protein TadD
MARSLGKDRDASSSAIGPGPDAVAGKPDEPAAVACVVSTPFELDLHSEYLRADLFLAMGQPTEAARILTAVVEAEPENEAALELLARAYFGSAQLSRAEEALARLVELAPANGWARRALARTLERQSRPDDAAVHHRVADALGAA